MPIRKYTTPEPIADVHQEPVDDPEPKQSNERDDDSDEQED